jgi:hypothetical protein
MASGPPQIPPEHSPDPASPVPAPAPGPAEPDGDDMAVPDSPASEPVWRT